MALLSDLIFVSVEKNQNKHSTLNSSFDALSKWHEPDLLVENLNCKIISDLPINNPKSKFCQLFWKKAIDKHNKDPVERPSSWPTTEDFGPNPVNAEFDEFAKLLYLDFAYKLLKLGALNNFIPKCLDQVGPYVNSKYPYIEFSTFKFYHTYMKYCYMNGEYEKCIENGNLCIKFFHVEMIEKEIAPDFGCEGNFQNYHIYC